MMAVPKEGGHRGTAFARRLAKASGRRLITNGARGPLQIHFDFIEQCIELWIGNVARFALESDGEVPTGLGGRPHIAKRPAELAVVIEAVAFWTLRIKRVPVVIQAGCWVVTGLWIHPKALIVPSHQGERPFLEPAQQRRTTLR